VNESDFKQIAPRCGGQREAFEELCCQLGHRRIPSGTKFVRLHGAGGDGGIECFADFADGSRVGWQAKYVFDIGSLITQATGSLTTALRIHPQLTRFILCFPFDLTGPTGRRGQSGIEKFDSWCEEQVQNAASDGRILEIEAWPASRLLSCLLEVDASGGIRKYFFDEQHLSPEWFVAHLNAATAAAGPRYTPELNVQTDVGQWFSAFGCTPEWHHELESRLREVRKKHKRLSEAITRTSGDSSWPRWPESLREEATALSTKISQTLEACDRMQEYPEGEVYAHSIELLERVNSSLSTLENKLVNDLEEEHGSGRADSPGFRQFMAEYQVSFPAANLDTTREALAAIRELTGWLNSAKGLLAFHSAFVLSGGWGAGKTHGVCDVALQRLSRQQLSCVIYGHQFDGEPDPWTRLTESLGLPITIGKDGLLDALNAAAEASGYPLVLFIDAINETRPIRYWRGRIAGLVQEMSSRPSLRVCFTCRTPYLSQCLPEAHCLPVLEHPGFKGVERIACTAFFNHYGLKPPIAPILQPELANPLYLRLVCETLKSRGIDRLPIGWSSTAQVIAAFLDEKEKEFAREKDIGMGSRAVTASLRGIVRAIAESGQSRLRWSEAYRVISAVRSDAMALRLVEWLIGSNLLIEEAADGSDGLPDESAVRPAFERLGDFLIASELMKRLDDAPLEAAFEAGGQLHPYVRDRLAVEENYGILSALSILIPEKYPGMEVPDLLGTGEIRDDLIKIVVASIPGRDPGTFSSASRRLAREALRKQDLSQAAMDNILAVSWRTSAIDAVWLHELLDGFPLAQRDAYWCGYLHESYEQSGTVKGLVDAAFDLPLEALDLDVAERWATALLWFTAAADRRVKDRATRALIGVLSTCSAIIPELFSRFLSVDDDEVRERLLLASYGSLILSRDDHVIRQLTCTLNNAFRDNPLLFDNALIRDHVRCISELAESLNVFPEGCDSQFTMQPIPSDWPLELPTEEQINNWGELLRFKPDEFYSDFFKYSMNCLRPWVHVVPKEEMGKWILQRAAHDFGYEDSGCEDYDRYVLGKHGGGRAKPAWVERIGKKYKWVAMYQLASRLHDHVERKKDSWDPEPLRTPLILLEERKLDPTLSLPASIDPRRDTSWWITAQADLDICRQLSDEEWVAREDDVPALEQLLSIVQHNGQNWRVLVSYPSWGQRSEDDDEDAPYRQVWIHIHGYLVSKGDFETAYDCLHRRNFFGRWLPQGATWLYGFAGEYPWATSFNTESEEWHGRGGFRGDLPVACQSAWNELAVEWEYDATLPQNIHMQVPARELFSPGDLWWDGQDGYRQIDGRTVFRDPSVTNPGPSSLLIDADDFSERLDKLGLRLIWTVLGEKWILGGPHDKQTPRRTFSQIASLGENGALQTGERVFFDDYDQDTGPRKCT